MFDHERLEVYQLQLQFIGCATKLLEEIDQRGARRTREVCRHLDEASVSVLLNLAEGNGKRQRQVRAKFLDDARGSATECAACLDALVAKSVCPTDRVEPGKAMLERVVSMLTKPWLGLRMRTVVRLINKTAHEARPRRRPRPSSSLGLSATRTRDEDEDERRRLKVYFTRLSS